MKLEHTSHKYNFSSFHNFEKMLNSNFTCMCIINLHTGTYNMYLLFKHDE